MGYGAWLFFSRKNMILFQNCDFFSKFLKFVQLLSGLHNLLRYFIQYLLCSTYQRPIERTCLMYFMERSYFFLWLSGFSRRFCCPLGTLFSLVSDWFAPTNSDSSRSYMRAYVGIYRFELLWSGNTFSASFQFDVLAMFVACVLWVEQTYGAGDWRVSTASALTPAYHVECGGYDLIWPWNRCVDTAYFICFPHEQTHRIPGFFLCLSLCASFPFCFGSFPLLCVLLACFPLLLRSALLLPGACISAPRSLWAIEQTAFPVVYQR